MIDDQSTDEHWLTYTEAAEKLGLTVNAVRALARRQGWLRRSPNVVGGQAWVAVPADRLAINGHIRGDRRSAPTVIVDQLSPINGHNPTVINDRNRGEPRQDSPAVNDQLHRVNGRHDPLDDHALDDRRSESTMINDHHHGERRPDSAGINDHNGGDRRSELADDRQLTEILAVVERITEPLREQITDLKNQLAAEKLLRTEDKARADRAEERVRELQERLEAEMSEHRRVVGLLTERIPARRSWWPWRRR